MTLICYNIIKIRERKLFKTREVNTMDKVYRSFDKMIFETEQECHEHEKNLYQSIPDILSEIKAFCEDTYECPDCPWWNSELDCCKFSEKDLNYPSNWTNPL